MAYLGRSLVALFCSVFVISAEAGVVGGPKHISGQLEPNTSKAYKFECQKGADCVVKINFAPKYQKERTKDECAAFKAMFWVDGEWFSTIPGNLTYVDTGSNEVLKCESVVGYGGGHKAASKNRTITIQVTNGNAWNAIFDLDTN